MVRIPLKRPCQNGIDMLEVYPRVEIRTPSRDEFTVQYLKYLLHKYTEFNSVCRIPQLFVNPRESVSNEKIVVVDHAIDRFVIAINRYSSYFPCLVATVSVCSDFKAFK